LGGAGRRRETVDNFRTSERGRLQRERKGGTYLKRPSWRDHRYLFLHQDRRRNVLAHVGPKGWERRIKEMSRAIEDAQGGTQNERIFVVQRD